MHGALDPITSAILKLATDILTGGHATQVWLVPACNAPSGTSRRHRLVLSHLAVEAAFRATTPVKVVDADSDDTAGELSDVLRKVQAAHTDKDFALICGSDHLDSVRSWRDGQWLWGNAKWLLIPRGRTVQAAELPAQHCWLEDSHCENSPAEMRLRLASCAGTALKAQGLLPLPVVSFMRRHALYGLTTPAAIPPSAMGRRRVVAVLGGSFNPPTAGHLQLAAEIIHSEMADQVLIVPCGPRADKPSLQIAAVHRQVMCELAVEASFAPDFAVRVDPIEIDLPQALDSLQLVRELRKRNTRSIHALVFGADLYEASQTWDGGLLWAESDDFLWVPRHGYPLPEAGPSRGRVLVPPSCVLKHRESMEEVEMAGATELACTSLETSSTDVRRRFVEGRTLALENETASASVFSYAVRYGLYPTR